MPSSSNRSSVFPLVLLSLVICVSPYAETFQRIGIIRGDAPNAMFGDDLVPFKDQNGDGIDELIITNGRGCNYLYRGGFAFDTVPFLVFDSTNPRGRDIGDANGDGWHDYACGGRSLYNWKLGIYFGGPLLDSARDFSLGPDINPPHLYPYLGGDINQNGTDELIATPADSRTVYLFELGSAFDTIPDLVFHQPDLPGVSAAFGFQIAVADFTGDGIQDVAVSEQPDNFSSQVGRVHLYFGGPAFDTVPDLTILRRGTFHSFLNYWSRVTASAGDINGDGADDLFVGNNHDDDTSFVYFGGPDMDDVPDLIILRSMDHVAPAGDLNSDGYQDLITSNTDGNPGSGSVFIFFGGPEVDGLWDVRLNNFDEPGYHVYWGNDVAGLGDFNGDHIGDFAFSLLDVDSRGLVYIYSGNGNPTDVNEPDESLPGPFTLYPCYPNPFNNATTISFSLSEKSSVKLDVIDLLGRTVAILHDGVISAGEHRLNWEGKDYQGHVVSSGVYFCRLSSGRQSQQQKLVLVK